MRKAIRELVHQKYNGLCAYTGKPLGDDWQVDHVTPKCHYQWHQMNETKKPDDVDNLLPAIKIINHYKRSLDLEGFRRYMLEFHIRLAKLPKKTTVIRTQKRKEYMLTVAELFNITADKPFSGKFYYENIGKE